MDPETMGIWLWIVPGIFKVNSKLPVIQISNIASSHSYDMFVITLKAIIVS